MATGLDARLAALRTLRETGEDRIPDSLLKESDDLLERATARRQRSPEHTVVGIFGATGSGKSSLVNAIVGENIARTHVRRPTTSEALAATWDGEGAVDLLDWLEVRSRIVRSTPIDPRAQKLILLDLPDFDSIESSNREIAERLAAQVDVLVWVVDPQKYADEVMHAQFIAPHARHGAVTIVVLNQVDQLAPAEVAPVVKSLREILERDGLPKAKVLALSARTGDGIPALRTTLGDLAAAQAAREARLVADISTIASRMPVPGTPAKLTDRGTARLVEELGIVAGADVVANAVGGSYRKRAAQSTGWPIVTWVLRLRADPLTRLGLGGVVKGRDPALHRTSMPALDAGARARVSLAVRGFGDAAAVGLSENWRAGIRETADFSIAVLPGQLDLAIASTPLPAKRSWWWLIFTVIQWIAILAALAGVLWLLGAALLPTIGLPSLPIPKVEGWAVPTLLIGAGLLLGILLGLIGTLLGAIGGAARRRSARKALLASVALVAEQAVVVPLRVQLDRVRSYAAALATARA